AHDMCPRLLSIWSSPENSRIKQHIGASSIGEFFVLTTHKRLEGHSRTGVASIDLLHSSARSWLYNVEFFVARTKEFIHWKFAAQPFSKYQVISCDDGVAAVRQCGYMRPKSGMIGDAWTKDERSIPMLLERAAVYLMTKGCESVLFGT